MKTASPFFWYINTLKKTLYQVTNSLFLWPGAYRLLSITEKKKTRCSAVLPHHIEWNLYGTKFSQFSELPKLVEQFSLPPNGARFSVIMLAFCLSREMSTICPFGQISNKHCGTQVVSKYIGVHDGFHMLYAVIQWLFGGNASYTVDVVMVHINLFRSNRDWKRVQPGPVIGSLEVPRCSICVYIPYEFRCVQVFRVRVRVNKWLTLTLTLFPKIQWFSGN